MDRVRTQQVQVRNTGAGLLGQYLAQGLEGVKGLLLEGLVDLVEDIGEV